MLEWARQLDRFPVRSLETSLKAPKLQAIDTDDNVRPVKLVGRLSWIASPYFRRQIVSSALFVGWRASETLRAGARDPILLPHAASARPLAHNARDLHQRLLQKVHHDTCHIASKGQRSDLA
jgi:hypothetical protein